MPSIVITSANRGLGFEFAKQYAADCWRVYAACRHPHAAADLRGLEKASAGQVTVLTMDVTDIDSVRAAVTAIEGAAVDILLNSAGVSDPSGQTAGAVDYKSWAQTLDVNTLGPARVTECFASAVARSDRKLVVTISSGMGSLAENISGGSIAYRSSKAAVNMVMRTIAIDLAPRGITCVVVSPGWVRTDMGGSDAKLAPAESVAALKSLLKSLGPAQSGRFFRHDGSECPW